MTPTQQKSGLVPLADLLSQQRAPHSLVAFSVDRRYDWSGFCGHVSGLCGRLEDLPRGRWMLACESSYDFAVGLFALWQTGNVVVLPPNSQPGSLEEADEGVRGAICDQERAGGKPWLCPVAAPGGAERRWRSLERSAVCVELCTSGSTGERKSVAKTLAQLEDELAVQERTFGARLGDCAVVATISHQHIYGLLHRLLWPLAARRPFSAQTPTYWEEVVAILRGQPVSCIVSSPAHLDRAGRDTAPALAGCRVVFSAGGPLRRSTAENIQRLTGCAMIELIGSTETGGVGWRDIGPGSGEDWRPYDGVEVSLADSCGIGSSAGAGPTDILTAGAQEQPGRLQVRSPFSSARREDPPQLLGDLGEVLPDGRFRICGRADRIVKIAESRVSLDDMERRLARHPWVAEAAVVVVEGGKSIVRESIAAVVVLRPEGRKILESQGREAVRRELRSSLRRHFASATLPRFFRYLEEMPHDAQGKTTVKALRALFPRSSPTSPTTTAAQAPVDLVPLADLLMRGCASDHLVAFSADRRYDWEGFCGHVSGLCGRLEGLPRGRWMLACESSYDFAVGLFALWQTGNVAVLPPNSQPGSLEDIDAGLCGTVCDQAPRTGGKPWLSPVCDPGKAGRRWRSLERSRVCLELFTSGSTGERKLVAKTLAQLESELAVQERTFGVRLGDCAVVATVSHQHIYGLLHRLLWPLSAQRPFSARTLAFWQEVVSALRGQPAACIVSSPVHLDRAGRDTAPAPALAGCRAVFSSGGPLRRSTTENIQRLTGCVPIEIFGSTETGGVGWRQQVGPGASADWRPLEAVEVSVAGLPEQPGRLQVRSPFALARREDPPQLLGDLGEVLSDGRFRVSGRADRIVKIAESRVSLDDMERRLARHPWVAEAALVVVEGGRSLRESIGAVVVLRPEARQILGSQGRQTVSRELRSSLRRHFLPATLPRFFRYPEELPHDAQGKTSALALRASFPRAFNLAVSQPERLECSRDDTQITLRLRVPSDLGYLDGHFPGFPVVPGVVQAMWVWQAAAELFGRAPGGIKGMEAVKFKELLLPGREFTLRVRRQKGQEGESLAFEIRDGETVFSSGRYLFCDLPEARG